MTRLEEIEAQIKRVRKITEFTKGCVNAADEICDLYYALDAYKARVAVLEEALKKLAPFVAESAFEVDSKLALTPEQCLERMKEVG